MRSYFRGKNGAGGKRNWEDELEDYIREISDDEEHPDRFTAKIMLLDRQSHKIRMRLCEAAIAGEFSERQMKEISDYFENELAKIEELVKKINGCDKKP